MALMLVTLFALVAVLIVLDSAWHCDDVEDDDADRAQ